MSDLDAWDQWLWSEPFRPADDDLSAAPAQAASFVSEHVNLSIPRSTADPAYRARPDTSPQPQKLGFIPPREWNREKDYGDEDPPQYITYRLGWKVKVNRRKWAEGTIQNVVLAPVWVWRKDVKHRIEAVEKSKKFGQKAIFHIDTEIALAVMNERKEKDVILPSNGKSVKWSEAERQLGKWSQQYPSKRLSMYLTLNYEQENDDAAAGVSHGRSAKRGARTVTQRMLEDRATELDRQERQTGQPPTWPQLFKDYRCSSTSCTADNTGSHCWPDPDNNNEHIPLTPEDMMDLVDLHKSGHELRTPADVPEHLRERWRARTQRRKGKKQKTLDSTLPQVTINNIMPEQSVKEAVTIGAAHTTDPVRSFDSGPMIDIDLTGLAEENIDGQLMQYGEWQQKLYSTRSWKQAVKTITDIALERALDLKQMFRDQNPDAFVCAEVPRDAARRFIDLIPQCGLSSPKAPALEWQVKGTQILLMHKSTPFLFRRHSIY